MIGPRVPAGPALPGSVAAGLFGSTSTTVYLIVVVLVAVGLAMIAVAVWLVRATRRDHVVLGPLERMGDRSWRKHDAERRRRELDDVRPSGASVIEPPLPGSAAELEPRASGVAIAAESAADPDGGASEPDRPVADEEPAVREDEVAKTDGESAPAQDRPQPAQQADSPDDRDSTPTGTRDPFPTRGQPEPDG